MSKLPMWNNPLQTLMVSIVIAVGVSLSACDTSKQNTVEGVASGISASSVNTETPTKQDAEKQVADLDNATVPQESVRYDIASWETGDIKPVSINELDNIQSTFGKVVTTDENSLDYASNPAIKYRFMKTDSPYLDVIDSQKYLELGWYFANAADSDKEKQLSQAHAKKAYILARQLMGDDGGKVLSNMLNGQIIKNQTAGGQKIELAKCEFYSCMLILNKAKSEEPVSDG